MTSPLRCRRQSFPCTAVAASTILFFSIAQLQAIDFNKEIRPILSNHCFECHGPDNATRQADLRLDLQASAMSVITPGKIKRSELIHRIESHDQDVMMPPADAKRPLTDQQRKLLTDWVREGAEYQQHWSFEPVQNQPTKRHRQDKWSQNRIDHYVYLRLKAEGLSP